MPAKKVYDIAIVGAGAAGMTAALYALRARKTVLIFEENLPGGQIIVTHRIDNYPAAPGISGEEFATTLRSQVEQFGGQFVFARVVSVSSGSNQFNLRTDNSSASSFFAKTVIIANGSIERKLPLAEAERFIGHGLSYCATCDGAFFRGKAVGVYGAGNTALYTALYLSDLAERVALIYRSTTFRGESHLFKRLSSLPNVDLYPNSIISALNSEPSGHSLVSVTLAQGSKTLDLSLRGLFVCIGRVPDNAAFKDLVELTSDGFINSDETCQTSCPGVFCAGDTRKKSLHQLVTAASDGAVAATTAVNFLQNRSCY